MLEVEGYAELMQELEETKNDGWTSDVTGAGSARDSRVSYTVAPNVRTTQRIEDRLVHGDSLGKRFVRMPAREMTREGFTIQSDDLDADARANLMRDLHKARLTETLCEALAVARLRGDSLVFVGADDGQDPETPLNKDRIRSIKFMHIFDRWTAQIDEWNDDPLSPNYRQPEYYRLGTSGRHMGTAAGTRVHYSRVVRFVGSETTQSRRDLNSGWNESLLVAVYDELRGHGVMWTSVESILKDFAQAVYKMKGLDNFIAQNDSSLIIERMRLMDKARSTIGAMLIDADKEDFQRQSTPIGGLDGLIDRFNARIAGAFDMPLTLLMGESAGGLGATGEGQQRQWADQVRGMQETFLLRPLEQLLSMFMSAKDGALGGNEPDAWSIQFESLYRENPLEEADRRLKIAQTDLLYIDAGVVTPSEVALSRFAGETYGAETVIDPDIREELKEVELEDLANPPAPPPMAPGLPNPEDDENE